MRSATETASFARPLSSSRSGPSPRQRLATAWARRRDPHLRLQIALATLFGAAVWAFGHVVEDYLTGDPLVRWDVEFSRWLHVHSSPALVSFFDAFTYAGSIPVLALVTAGVTFYLLRHGRLNEAGLLCVAALGIEILNPILKLVFHRPRPELAYVHLETYSFPSGHSVGSAAVYALVLYLLARRAGRHWQMVAAAGYVVLVASIGFSRLYLEVHYLSDVLGGVSLGVAWAAASLFIYEWRHDAVARFLPRRVRAVAARLTR